MYAGLIVELGLNVGVGLIVNPIWNEKLGIMKLIHHTIFIDV